MSVIHLAGFGGQAFRSRAVEGGQKVVMLDGTILQASHEWEEGEVKLLVLVEPPAGVEKTSKVRYSK